MKNKKRKPIDKISAFENELLRIQSAGHISSFQKVHDKSNSGVELFLGFNIPPHQAASIAQFIQKTYNFDALFYVKKNTIRVTYKE